jgi:two-component system response regulator DevR
MSEPEPIQIMLVDDHRVVRAGLRTILSEYPRLRIVGESASAAEAMREIGRIKPHVVLLDVHLPDEDGCMLCAKIKSLPIAPRVLILTSFADEELFLRALTNGADGYMLKDSRDDALASAIVTVFEGGTVWGQFATQCVKARFQPGAQNGIQGKYGQLSPVETRILSLVAEGKTNKEIATQTGSGEKTVRNQISTMMGKLGVERRAQAAAYFVRHSK